MTIAIFFSFILFNNLTDFETNHWCVKSVLAMEGIKSKEVLWRAIQTPWIVTLSYILIIITEATIAFLCWLSALLMLVKNKGKLLAQIALIIAFGLFMVAFVIIGGEWFYMWQHPILGGLQMKATIFALLMLCSLFFID